MTEYGKDSIPSHTLGSNGHVWTYEKLDPRIHQWTRPLDQREFDWDVLDADFVGTDIPIRAINLELRDEWVIQGLETTGPDYHRPGLTETISSDYVSYTVNLEEAIEVVEDFVGQLS